MHIGSGSLKMFRNYTCRSSYSVFNRNQKWGAAFSTPNEHCSLAFGSRRNRVSRNLGQAWSEVFNACESTVWTEFFFHQLNTSEWW